MLVLVWACEKSPEPEPDQPPSDSEGTFQQKLFVLNEGLFNQNNSSLTLIGLENKHITKNYYEQQNGEKLGDTGNDLLLYGHKLYIAMNNSNNLTVIDPVTGEKIKRIPMVNESGKGREPRKLAAWNGKVLLTNFDGTVAVIDTAAMSVDQYIRVGRNPEGISVFEDNAYVANSGGLDAPDYDTTVSVIQLNQMEETSRITVGINPGAVATDAHGHVYVVSRGDYGDTPPVLKVWSVPTQSFVKTYDFEASGVQVSGDTVFTSYYDYGSGASSIKLIDASTLDVIQDDFISGVDITTLYSIHRDKSSGHIYLGEALDFQSAGEVIELSADGEELDRFDAGVNPGTLLTMKAPVEEE